MIENKKFYSLREVIQDQVTDFDIIREKPLAFKAGGTLIFSMPVMYYEHPEFLSDLGDIIEKHIDILAKISFLSTTNFKDHTAIQKAIGQISFFSDTAQYKRFIKKDVPRFIQRWAKTVHPRELKKWEAGKIEDIKFVKIKRHRAKKFLGAFRVDELLYILMTIWIFNFDVVKKNFLSFIEVLQGGEVQNPRSITQHTSSTQQKEGVGIPKFSVKPFSKTDWDTFDKLRRMN